jgi:hypothetical protein
VATTVYAIFAPCRNTQCSTRISFGQATGDLAAADDINSFEEKTIVCPICKTKFRCTRNNLEKTPVRPS